MLLYLQVENNAIPGDELLPPSRELIIRFDALALSIIFNKEYYTRRMRVVMSEYTK